MAGISSPMRAWKSETHFHDSDWIYGSREEAVSLFDLIRRKGIACTDAICMCIQCDPRGKQGQIPTESALAVEKGGRYHPPKRCLNHV